MSTNEEKLEAIKLAVESSKKRKAQIEFIIGEKRNSPQYRSMLYELDMCNDCIKRGEKILNEQTRISKIT